VADGSGEHGFCYLNLRMARGRSSAVHQATGQALAAAVKAHLAPLLDAADRRRRRGLRRQAGQPAPLVQQGLTMLDDNTVKALARQLYDARKTRTPLRHFSPRAPGHEHRRRLRHPARLGGAGTGRRPHASRAARSA
jgi:chloramphenicol 3-O-phosphotransferase